MFCTNCGNECEAHALFCSKCGAGLASAPVQPAASAVSAARDWNMHVNILAWLLIGTALLTGVIGAAIMFGGHIVTRLPMWIPDAGSPPDVPVDVLRFAGSIAGLVGLFTLALSAGIAAAGVGLLQYRDWARVLAIIMSALLVLHFPLGTAIGIYGLWILLSEKGREYYKARSV